MLSSALHLDDQNPVPIRVSEAELRWMWAIYPLLGIVQAGTTTTMLIDLSA